jgi:hypothetical protein
MRISDCGLEDKAMLSNPHSAIRIPQLLHGVAGEQ